MLRVFPHHDLIGLQRSAAMLREGQTIPLPRASILALCDEVLASRQIIERLGTDLRTIAQRVPT